MAAKRSVCTIAMLAVAVLLLAAFSPTAVVASNSHFMVVASHTPEECLKVLDEVNAKGAKLLSAFEWGCMAGDHTGYAFVDAKDEDAVRAMMPASMQHAKITKVTKFSAQQIKSFHEKH
jgi:hypothetical protein